jgi:hypothetical protein
MKTRWHAGLMALTLTLGRAGAGEPAAPGPGGKVQLPPMLIEESVANVPWYYVNAGGVEFLSRCSASTTRALALAWLEKLQLVRLLVAEELLAQMDCPTIFVLHAQDLEQTVSAEIQRELQGRDGRSRGEGVNIAPSMRLADRDMHASIAYIDETLFDAATLSVSPGHVGYLLRGRVPELPGWAIEGLERVYRSADFVLDPVTLRPATWIDEGETYALAGDVRRPRAVLTAAELFGGQVLRGRESAHPRRAAVRAATQELFVRWAVGQGAETRRALWDWAAAGAEGLVTEEMFQARFGFDYAELRDRLSDYLPKAVTEVRRLAPEGLPPLPRVEVERATPGQVARVRGEWERLAMGYVGRRMPQVREPYVAQARRTLRRAFDAGERDPRLLATMGLCEIDAGNAEGARPHLEAAVAAGVVRPRAYLELARLQHEALGRDAAPEKTFSFGELAPILDVLRRGLAQAPALPEAFVLLGNVWERGATAPNAAELAELERGARLYWRRPSVVLPIARALVRHGHTGLAQAALGRCAGDVADDEDRSELLRLQRELAQLAPASEAAP